MVLYAAEGYSADGGSQNWGLANRNSSAIDKTFNSGAAQTPLRLDSTWLTPATTHLEFTRYRLTFTSIPAGVTSAMTMTNVAMSLLGLVESAAKAKFEPVLQRIGDALAYDMNLRGALYKCVNEKLTDWETYADRSVKLLEAQLIVGTTASPEESQEAIRKFLLTGGVELFTDVTNTCILNAAATFAEATVWEYLKDSWQRALVRLGLKWGSPLGWLEFVAKSVNDFAPLTVSLLSPTNAMAGYDLEWTGTQLTGAKRNDARPTGSTGSPLVRPPPGVRIDVASHRELLCEHWGHHL